MMKSRSQIYLDSVEWLERHDAQRHFFIRNVYNTNISIEQYYPSKQANLAYSRLIERHQTAESSGLTSVLLNLTYRIYIL